MTPEQKEQHRNLVKKYNIHFDGPDKQATWPITHSQAFQNIQKLGKTEYQGYRDSVTADSAVERPWRENTRLRAAHVSSLASGCRPDNLNEATWRLKLEHAVLARFTIEIACRRCRARLWRSEIEAASVNMSLSPEDLEKRQKNRRPCLCRPWQRGVDAAEPGIYAIFDDRADEAIVQEHPLQTEMQKKEQPDRVYGLRATTRLEKLLSGTVDKREASMGKFIGQCIKSSPFRRNCAPVHFPFLALEENQKKEDLRRAANREGERETFPLVWFLAYKGHQWHVAAAYIEYDGDSPHYHVVDLWDGRIDSLDGALQLLLIIDYIFDWARDIYREAIIGNLRELAASNTESLANDSDVFSLADRISSWPEDNEFVEKFYDYCDGPGLLNTEHPDRFGVEDVLQPFDSLSGVIRDATFIQSRLMGLYVTEDNLSAFLRLMQTPQGSQRLAEPTLRCLKHSFRVSRNTLDVLELMWTGKERKTTGASSPDDIFLVTATVSAYISQAWEQTREFSYVAVSEPVVGELIELAGLQNSTHWSTSDFPYVDSGAFVDYFQKFLHTSVKDNLLAAISRASVSTKRYELRGMPSDQMVCWIESAENILGTVEYRFDAAIKLDSDAYEREWVSVLYNRYSRGYIEPSSTFLRISNRRDEQKLPNDEIVEGPWKALPNIPADEKQDLIFVISKNPGSYDARNAELCIFMMDRSKIDILLDPDTAVDPPPACQFRTRKLDTEPGWGNDWNIKDVQLHDADIFKGIEEYTHYLKKFRGFSKYGKGKSVERPTPANVLEPKEQYSSSTMAERTSHADVLHFGGVVENQRPEIASSATSQPIAEERHEYTTVTSHGVAGSCVPSNAGVSSSLKAREGSSPSSSTSLDVEGPSTANFPFPNPLSAGERPNSAETTHTEQIINHQDTTDNGQQVLSRKRNADVSEAGPSSASASKKPRTEDEADFSEDYLDEYRLNKLLEEGFFGS